MEKAVDELRDWLRMEEGRAFLRFLEERFPETSWKAASSLEDLRRQQGQHEVIDLIKDLAK